MIKIISISNCHIFDGVEMYLNEFNNLLSLLKYSKFVHTVEYEQDGIEFEKKIGFPTF